MLGGWEWPDRGQWEIKETYIILFTNTKKRQCPFLSSGLEGKQHIWPKCSQSRENRDSLFREF